MEKILIDTQEKFDSFISDIGSIFAFDTETNSLNTQTLKIVGMSFSNGGDKAYYLPLGHKTLEAQLNINDIKSALKRLFMDAHTLIGHNLVFDMQVLIRGGIYPEETNWFDTMVAQHLVDENDRKGLKYLAKKYFNVDMETFEQVSGSKTLEHIPPSRVKSYACDDAIYTWKLFEILNERINELDLFNLFRNIEMPFLRCIIDMEQNGVLVDQEYLRGLNHRVTKKIEEMRQEIIRHLPKRYKQESLLTGTFSTTFNLSSPKQLRELLYTELKLPIIERSEKTGAPSTGMPALKQIKNNHPILIPLIKYKEYQKLKTAFIESLPGHIEKDGRVHCNFLNTGTVTGRLSSSNPNLQQLPNNDEINIRSCFIAGQGRKLLTLDFKNEEVRLTAFLSHDENMIDGFEKGMDVHFLVANKIFNLNLTDEELTDGTEVYKLAKEKYKKQRYKAKTTVFSILYGAGKHNVSGRLGISLNEASELIDNYFNLFPKVKGIIDATHKEVEKNDCVRNYYGRYRHFVKDNFFHGNNAFRQSFNFRVQGFASDILRVAMVNIKKFLKENNDEAKLLFTVHDELTLEVPEDRAQFYFDNVKRIMETALIIKPALLVDGAIGDNYGETK